MNPKDVRIDFFFLFFLGGGGGQEPRLCSEARRSAQKPADKEERDFASSAVKCVDEVFKRLST